jgi:3-dehydroquinate dehydratase-2
MKKILILNGPNLNMLGMREPEIYGTQTLQDIQNLCEITAKPHNIDVDFRQSNHEGILVDWIQEAIQGVDGLIINAAAYTHTSVAIHDALKLLSCPIIEVHLSDPETREEFRHISYIAPIATKIIKGNGATGYAQAIEFIINL